jgi:molecular chaperone GrpE
VSEDPRRRDRNERGDESSGGVLPPSPELEAALREAEEAVDSHIRPAGQAVVAAGGDEPAEGSEVEILLSQVSESSDRLLRLQADFENFRKRATREREETLRFGAQNLIKDLLSAVDNLDRAIDHARQSDGGDLEGLLQGVELVRRELLTAFEKHHVTTVDAQGMAFDPALHEAIAQAPDGSVEPNTVIDVLQKGYRLRDRLIRPARVVVSKAPGEDEGTGNSERGPGESTG